MNCVGNSPQSNSNILLNLFGDFYNEGDCLCYGDIYRGECYSSISMSGVAYVRRNNVSIRAFYYFARMYVCTLTLG